jgi:hypothetical protein
MNSKGTYTALFGLIVLILMVSMVFFSATTAGSQKTLMVVKEAGDLKRVFNNTRLVVDKAVSYAMTQSVLEDFRLNDACRTNQNMAATVNQVLFAVALDIKRESGFDCQASVPAIINDNQEFSVSLVCSRLSVKGDKGVYSVSTQDSFNLTKNVVVDTNIFAYPRDCNVTVFDVNSGLLEANDFARQIV